jgi:hypothetical protein
MKLLVRTLLFRVPLKGAHAIIRGMELSLIVSVISICGFAGALTYNVYEFRKVGKRLDDFGTRLDHLGTTLNDLGRRLDDFGTRLDHLGRRLENLGTRLEDLGRRLEDFGRTTHEEHLKMMELLGKIADKLTG